MRDDDLVLYGAGLIALVAGALVVVAAIVVLLAFVIHAYLDRRDERRGVRPPSHLDLRTKLDDIVRRNPEELRR